MYTEKVMEHFNNPRNQRKMEEPDGVGKVGNPACGDVMWLYIKVSDRGEDSVIEDISWETFGCTAAIATSSMITDIAKGKTLEEAVEITNRKVADELDGLPPVKMHCSNLAADGLIEALYDYYTKVGREVPKSLEDKHEKIEVEMDRLEEKYGEYLSMEEELHNSAG